MRAADERADVFDGDSPDAPAEPTGNEVLRNLFRDRSLPGLIGGCEGLLGLIVTTLLALCVIVVGPVAVFNAWTAGYPRVDRNLLIAVTAALLPLAVLEWRTVVYFARGLADVPHPVPVNLALRQPDRPLVVRAVVAAWWFAHAVAFILLGHWIANHMTFLGSSAWERALQYVVPLIVMLGAAFAMNTHLLMSLHALTRSERLVRAVWPLRIVVDLTLIFLVPAIRLRLLEAA